jgi:predicted ferric reductase
VHTFNQILIFLHFIGLAMGFATGIANGVMMDLITKAAPPDKAVLARFPPTMARVGQVGIALLWLTGLTLVFGKWGGFGSLPWSFYVKLAAVVVLTIVVAYMHVLGRRIMTGDTAAAARVPTLGRIAMLAALTAVVFAVVAFD